MGQPAGSVRFLLPINLDQPLNPSPRNDSGLGISPALLPKETAKKLISKTAEDPK